MRMTRSGLTALGLVMMLLPAIAAAQDVTPPAQPDLDPTPSAPAASPAPTPPAPSVAAPAVAAPAVAAPGPIGVPAPVVPDTTQRSGLITRFTPVPGYLPPDPKRDTFYRSRYDDWYHPFPRGRNCYKDGGLYGKPWGSECTAAVYPYFRGAPGKSSVTPCCEPPTKLGRYIVNYIQPFRPVGMYYDRGAYTPIYDLDPIVPGPGPFPWNHYKRLHTGG